MRGFSADASPSNGCGGGLAADMGVGDLSVTGHVRSPAICRRGMQFCEVISRFLMTHRKSWVFSAVHQLTKSGQARQRRRPLHGLVPSHVSTLPRRSCATCALCALCVLCVLCALRVRISFVSHVCVCVCLLRPPSAAHTKRLRTNRTQIRDGRDDRSGQPRADAAACRSCAAYVCDVRAVHARVCV